MGTSQNQGGAILLRAKGTVAPLDLSTVNQVPRALSWKLVAAWVALIVAGGQAPGHSGPPQGLVLPNGLLGSSRGRRWPELNSGGKAVEGTRPGSLLQPLLPRVPAALGALLPCIRVARLPLFEAECQEWVF